MQLRLRDAAELFEVTDQTIARWVKERSLPAMRISGQYRFNREELLEWATSRQVRFSARVFAEFTRRDQDEVPGPELTEALTAGGIHHGVPGRDQESVLRSVIERMPLPAEVDREFFLSVLLARETLGSTGVGNGIAIPHVRNPVVLHVPRPLITLCFLETAVAFGAPDGEPVHTLFTLVSPTVSTHLKLLSRLAFALHQPVFAQAIARRSPAATVLTAAAAVDQGTDETGRDGGRG